jgi:hypothetical protein
MGDWLVRHFSIFGVQAQNWMPLALALIAVAIIFAWVSNSRLSAAPSCRAAQKKGTD